MNRRLRNRVAAVANVLGSRTVARSLAQPAFKVFRDTGALPEDPGVAHEVVQRALRGYDAFPDTGDPPVDRQQAIRAAVEAPLRPPDPIMDELYDEAVWAPQPMRWAAREVLQQLAALGLDVTAPLFAGRQVKDCVPGMVGLSLLGISEILSTTPHESRAAELNSRLARLQERVGDDPQWFGALQDAEATFEASGELPADELLREGVLAAREIDALLAHGLGQEVAETLATIDRLRATRPSRRGDD